MRLKFLILFVVSLYAQLNSQTTFRKEYGFGLASMAADASIIQASDGGFIFAGLNNNHAILVRTNSLGNILWQQEFTTNTITSASKVLESENSYYIFGVQTDSVGNSQYCVIKTDTSGALIWFKRYDLPGNLTLECLAYGPYYNTGYGNYYSVKAKALSNGNLVFVGFAKGTPSVNSYTQIILIDSGGTVLWTRQVPGTKIKGYDVEVLTNPSEFGNDKIYVLADNSYSSSMTEFDLDGNLIWSKFYTGITMLPGALCYTSDNALVISGRKISSNSNELFIMKTDTSGAPIWSKTYQLGYDIWVNNSTRTPNGGVVVAGGCIYSNVAAIQTYMMQVDGNGNVLWNRGYLHPSYSESDFECVITCADQSYAAFGICGDPPTPIMFYMVKTDNTGNSNCNDYINNPVSSDVVISVYEEQPSPNFSLTVVNQNINISNYNLADSVICLQTSVQEAQSNEQITISPNPSNGRIKIGRETEALSYDVIGANGKIVHSDKLGREEYLLDLSFLSDGVYILRLNYKNSASTQPLIIAH